MRMLLKAGIVIGAIAVLCMTIISWCEQLAITVQR